MPVKIVNMIKALYAAHVYAVQTKDGMSDWLPVESRVRQGCLLSLILFSVLIGFVLRACHFRRGIKQFPERRVHNCDLADDIVLVAHCQEDIQHNLDEL